MMDLNGFSCLSSNAESHVMAAHHVWLIPGALPDDGFEKNAGVPHWTSRACGQAVGCSLAAQGRCSLMSGSMAAATSAASKVMQCRSAIGCGLQH